VFSSEDAPNYIMRPRFDAAVGDPSRLARVDKRLKFPSGLGELRDYVRKIPSCGGAVRPDNVVP